jgi:hypothetical protein
MPVVDIGTVQCVPHIRIIDGEAIGSADCTTYMIIAGGRYVLIIVEHTAHRENLRCCVHSKQTPAPHI